MPASSWVDSGSEGFFVRSLDGCIEHVVSVGGRVLQFDYFWVFAQLESQIVVEAAPPVMTETLGVAMVDSDSGL